MQLGTLLPLGDIGGSAALVREYAQAAEAIGFDFVEAPDHVLGVNAASRPGWDGDTNDDLFPGISNAVIDALRNAVAVL